MGKTSAGLLLYRESSAASGIEVLLVHPGGPFWRNKDEGAWTIPKGEIAEGEEPFETAKREFEEETGVKASGQFLELQPVTQKGGKTVYAWAVEGDLDVAAVKSNTFKME